MLGPVDAMSRDVNELSSRDITSLGCVKRIRPGLLAVDVERLRATRTAQAPAGAGRSALNASGIVKAGFVVDQNMYEDGRYE